MSRYWPLICLALTHTLVDTCALLVAPLWPRLEQKFSLGMAGLSLAFVVHALPTAFSQAAFGYLRDRRATPIWIWLGPVLAATFLTLIGIAPSEAVLYALLIAGGIGVGAFHPEAAVTAARLLPEQRTRSLSLFMFGGALGLALGPTLSGAIVDRWGLHALAYLAVPMILLVLLLRRAGNLAEATTPVSKKGETRSIGEMMQGRSRLAVGILVLSSLRLVPNMGMDKVIAFTLEQQGHNVRQIGFYQTLFLVSASVGMFAMAFAFRAGWEKGFLVGCPIVGIPLLYVLGNTSSPSWLFAGSLALSGLVLWGTTPAMVSYAQQLFPTGAGLASAITMGLSWGIGGLIQAPLTAYFQSTGHPQLALHAFIPCLAVAAIGCCFLPKTSEMPLESAPVRPTPRSTAACPDVGEA
jgi:FSR family fosmidomycin resistance protein-like MFS transporter